jgi:hypothetical protein
VIARRRPEIAHARCRIASSGRVETTQSPVLALLPSIAQPAGELIHARAAAHQAAITASQIPIGRDLIGLRAALITISEGLTIRTRLRRLTGAVLISLDRAVNGIRTFA